MFTNGFQTALFEDPYYEDSIADIKLATIQIDQRRQIKQISFKVNDRALNGIRLNDSDGNQISGLTWSKYGKWIVKDIPDDEYIISFKC